MQLRIWYRDAKSLDSELDQDHVDPDSSEHFVFSNALGRCPLPDQVNPVARRIAI
jgi:hypothetical protein